MKTYALSMILSFFSLISCTKEDNKHYCTEISHHCELSKDYVVVKILECSNDDLNGFGVRLRQGFWYTFVPKTQMLFPYRPANEIYSDANLDQSIKTSKLPFSDTQIKFDTVHDVSLKEVYSNIVIGVLCTEGHFEITNASGNASIYPFTVAYQRYYRE